MLLYSTAQRREPRTVLFIFVYAEEGSWDTCDRRPQACYHNHSFMIVGIARSSSARWPHSCPTHHAVARTRKQENGSSLPCLFAAVGKSSPKATPHSTYSNRRSMNGAMGSRTGVGEDGDWPAEDPAHGKGIAAIMKYAILALICALAFFIRLFAVVRRGGDHNRPYRTCVLGPSVQWCFVASQQSQRRVRYAFRCRVTKSCTDAIEHHDPGGVLRFQNLHHGFTVR